MNEPPFSLVAFFFFMSSNFYSFNGSLGILYSKSVIIFMVLFGSLLLLFFPLPRGEKLGIFPS